MDAQDTAGTEGGGSIDQRALDGLSVAPPPEDEDAETQRRAIPEIREAMDAGYSKGLRNNPSDDNSKLDIALDETFPTSDAPSNTQPGKGKDPAPSSGYDEAAEAERARAS